MFTKGGKQRRLTEGRLVSNPISPVQGIGPGSAFATFELAMLLTLPFRRIQAKHNLLSSCVHVDDVHMGFKAASSGELVHVTIAAAKDVIEEVEVKLGLPFDASKAQLQCTCPVAATSILAALGMPNSELVTSAIFLGLEAPLRRAMR